MAANLWLYNSSSQTIDVGDTITVYAKLNPDTVSSSISAYTAKILINGSLKGSAQDWEKSGTNWATSCSYTFNTAGSYTVAIALCNSSGSYLGEKTGSITITVEEAQPDAWSWSSTIGGTLEVTPTGTDTYDVYPLTAREWNRFLDRIAEWVDYLGVTYWASDFAAAEATSGTKMKASQAQAVVSLLEALDPPTSPPSAPYAGDSISASFINGLAKSLNSLRS